MSRTNTSVIKNMLLVPLLAASVSGCVTSMVTNAIERNYKTEATDSKYTVLKVYENREGLNTSMIVCFEGKLAYKHQLATYHVELQLREGEFGRSVVELNRSYIREGCEVSTRYSVVEITNEYPHDHENVWYATNTKFDSTTGSPGCRSALSNSLGCHGSSTQKITFVSIQQEEYRGQNFDPTYALYVPAVVADIVLSPVYFVTIFIIANSIGNNK